MIQNVICTPQPLPFLHGDVSGGLMFDDQELTIGKMLMMLYIYIVDVPRLMMFECTASHICGWRRLVSVRLWR